MAADEPRLHPQPPNLNRQTAAQRARALPSPSRWRPLRTGVRLSGHWWCASPGEWGASQHHLGDGTGDSSALPAIALCLARRLFCGFPGNSPQACTEIASADKRTASVPHIMLASRPSMPPSRSTTPKRSRFGLAAGSAGHAAGSAAVAALRRGNIANAFRCTPAVPAD